MKENFSLVEWMKVDPNPPASSPPPESAAPKGNDDELPIFVGLISLGLLYFFGAIAFLYIARGCIL